MSDESELFGQLEKEVQFDQEYEAVINRFKSYLADRGVEFEVGPEPSAKELEDDFLSQPDLPGDDAELLTLAKRYFAERADCRPSRPARPPCLAGSD
jgi:hypothetical protein